MATKNIVPRGNNEGQLGTDEKRWNSVIAETASFTTFSGSITGNEFTLFSGSAQSTASFGFLMGDGRGLTNLTATATPGGSDNHVQFNDGGTTGGDAGFQYNKTTNSITHITNITASGHISSSATSTGSFGLILGDGSQLTNLPASFTSAGISGSFTPTSSSLASRVSNIVDGTTIVASASNAITASHALNSGVTSYTSLTNVPTDIVSGSAQLATSISGSFTSTSSSLASRLTTAESELSNTLISGSAQIASYISGSFNKGFEFDGKISGSITSTGSFGRIEVSADTLAIGGTELNKTVADNITDLDQELNTTSSPVFSGLRVAGDITAERYIVSSSVTFMTQSFSSGSTIFGDTLDDTHVFTGSVNITGSATITSRSPLLHLNEPLGLGGDSAVRLTEDGNFRGGFIKYDGTNNLLKIGTHTNNNRTLSDDIETIQIQRTDGVPTFVVSEVNFREYLLHEGDSDTYVRFQGNQVDLSAGGNIFEINTTSLSGSASSTGSFGRVLAPIFGGFGVVSDVDDSAYAILHVRDQTDGSAKHSFRINQNPSSTEASVDTLKVRGETSANALGIYQFGTGNIAEFLDGNTAVTTIDQKGSVSGSASSTGSFGSLVVADKVQGDLIVSSSTSGAILKVKTTTTNGDAFAQFDTDSMAVKIGADGHSGTYREGVISVSGNRMLMFKLGSAGGDKRVMFGASGGIGLGDSYALETATLINHGIKAEGTIYSDANISGSATSTGSFGQVTTTTPGRIIGNITEIIEVTVVDDGGNHYAFEGATTPNLVVSEGKTYRFDQSDSTNDSHPFAFSLTEDGSTYTTGVTTVGTPGVTGAYTEIKVTKATANRLFYKCTSHSGMGNQGNILKNDLGNFGGNISGSSTSTGSFARVEAHGGLHIPTVGSQANGILFGDGDTGFYETADDDVYFKRGGNTVFRANTSSQLDIGVQHLFFNTTGGFFITTGAGSAAAPNYVFRGDQDTGMYRSADNVIGFSAGGALQLEVASNKISGSATSTGSFARVDSHHTLTKPEGLFIASTISQSHATINSTSGSHRIYDSSDDLVIEGVNLGSKGAIQFKTGNGPGHTSNATHMVISTNGNVGIDASDAGNGLSTDIANHGGGLTVYDGSTSIIKLVNAASGVGASDGMDLMYGSTGAVINNREATKLRLVTNSNTFTFTTDNQWSGSATSTGSFGHVMVGGNNFTTAVSESAAASGFGTGGGGSGISNVVEDTTPQLGGNLDTNGNDIVLSDTTIIYYSGSLGTYNTDNIIAAGWNSGYANTAKINLKRYGSTQVGLGFQPSDQSNDVTALVVGGESLHEVGIGAFDGQRIPQYNLHISASNTDYLIYAEGTKNGNRGIYVRGGHTGNALLDTFHFAVGNTGTSLLRGDGQKVKFHSPATFFSGSGEIQMTGSLVGTSAQFTDYVGNVSGSATSTGSFGRLETVGASNIGGILSIPGFPNVSSSLAAAVAGGDNLGNHTATQDINLDGNNLTNVSSLTATGNISSSLSSTGSFGTLKLNNSNGDIEILNSTDGSMNVIIGDKTTGENITTGADNVVIGQGISAITGENNVYIGAGAAAANATPNNCVAVGYAALSQGAGNQRSVAVGMQTLQGNGSTINSTAVGHQAGKATTSGEENAFFGYASGDTNTTGDKNVTLGSGADVSIADAQNQIAIGHNVTSTGDNQTVIGNSDQTHVVFGGNALISGSAQSSGSFGVYSNNFIPSIDNTHDLGSSTHRWANAHIGDIELSNEGTEGNEVDGTTGSWTIQEGEDDLYLLNRKNGKKYKFKLEEIE